MSSIIKSRSGNYTYLYESTSYRNENGQPRSKRVCALRIYPVTGTEVYYPEYIERTLGTDKQPKICDNDKFYSTNDIKASRNLEFGVQYLLSHIAENTGLTASLKYALPTTWERVLVLACFIVTSGEPAMYCDDWLKRTDSIDSKELTSQKISELLLSITNTERTSFYEKWDETMQEQEYFALDITFVSSYSELIGDVAWGYNRDGEKLPQINICILVGEKSRLAIFSIVYNGALKDVSTLKSTLAILSGIDLKNIHIVMDKGFGSKKNIDAMLAGKDNLQFLVAVPFTMGFAKNQVESERKDTDAFDNTIVIGDDIVRGVTKLRSWNIAHKLTTHIFFNSMLAKKRQNELYGKVAYLRELVIANPDDAKIAEEASEYLLVRKSTINSTGITVSVRDEVIEKELFLVGWWLLAISR
ncbi:hypothetical protein FACS1894188_02430 [Clostridia bacterium]|nr:hypothetical protein FACS1894188_02430 [Clostridia bacterium]